MVKAVAATAESAEKAVVPTGRACRYPARTGMTVCLRSEGGKTPCNPCNPQIESEMSGFRVPSRGDGAQIVEIPFGHTPLLLGWATFPTSRGVIFCVNVVPAPRYHLAEPP